MFGKRGEGPTWELGKIIIAVIVLVLLLLAVGFLLVGKGGNLLDKIKETLRFGRCFLSLI